MFHVRKKPALLMLLGGALALSGCFNPSYGDEAFRCTLGSNACPDGYKCRELDHPTEPGAKIFQCVSESISAIPAVVIRLPSDTVEQGANLELQTTVTDFDFNAAAADGPPVSGQGHAHAYLDSVGEQTYLKRVTGPTVQVPIPADARVGKHQLIVALAENNHDLVMIGGNIISATLPFNVVAAGSSDGGGGSDGATGGDGASGDAGP
ncbi:MAG: hypothetical protein KC503_31090 [Myxococcales bacterium]|nr:hypothetical protein [Myxococcales bacterium]